MQIKLIQKTTQAYKTMNSTTVMLIKSIPYNLPLRKA